MKTQLTALFAAALLLLPSCGDSSAKTPNDAIRAGQTALSTNDWQGALSNFGAALTMIDAKADPNLALQAKLGQAEAQAHLAPAQARDTFLALMETSEVKFADFSTITTALSSGGHFDEAIDLLTKGNEKGLFGEKLQALITKVGDNAATAGDEGAMDALKGLGYVGGEK